MPLAVMKGRDPAPEEYKDARVMNNKKQQQGQAIVEMCAGMIAIMAIFLGLVFIGGIGISNIQTLLRNKSATETVSRATNQGGQGYDIYAWDYGDQANSAPAADEFQGHRLFSQSSRRDELAFTPDDRRISNSIQPEQAFQNPFNPMSQLSTTFIEDNKLRERAASGSASDTNSFYFLGAANLVSSQGSADAPIYTLRKQESETADGMKQTFSALFGINANINLQNISNQVYYPATGNPVQN
jgi:hypothetical protein